MYMYLDKEKAKIGIACSYGDFHKKKENYEEYYKNKAIEYVGNSIPYFITYLENENTIREATEEEKLARNQRELASNEIINKNGKIVSYDVYSQKIIDNEIVEKTREDYISEGFITLESEKNKARSVRAEKLKTLDLYDKAVLRGDILETEEMKQERDEYRKSWLELPDKYIDLSVPIEELYPKQPIIIEYFNRRL